MMAFFRQLFTTAEPIQPGIYHYQSPPDDPRNYRLHLRVEEDGSGVLIVNASTVLHLNQTATEYAYHFVRNSPADQVAQKISKRYSVSVSQAVKDYRDVTDRILTLVEIPDLDPITFLDFDRQPPFARKISAPYRLDCAITYHLPEGSEPGAAPVKRVERELTTQEWKSILDKAWAAGIPHIVFTGGEPTLRDDLPELIAHAERNGQVSGLLTDGLRLADGDYLNRLLQTGLDHLMLILQPSKEAFWQGLEKALAGDIFTAVHVTASQENAPGLPALLKKLSEAGVSAISLSTSDPQLEATLQSLRDQVAVQQMELVWNLPVPYSSQNPVALEVTGGDMPEAAGRAWLYVEPDGDVLPAQGINQVLGNFLSDPWEKIWKK
jgi:hypothetical protein